MIEDSVDNENRHEEQASISHRRAHKAAAHGGQHSSACSPRQTAPDPRSDKDTATDPFVPQHWLVALKIIWHWGDGQKTAEWLMSDVTLNQFSHSEMSVLMPEHADLGEASGCVCFCVHSQVDRSLIESAAHRRTLSRLQQSKPVCEQRAMGLDFACFAALKVLDNRKIRDGWCAVCFLSSVLCQYKSELNTAVHTCPSVTWIGQRCSRNIGFLVLIDSRSPRSKRLSQEMDVIRQLDHHQSSTRYEHQTLFSVFDSTRRRVHARVSMSLLYLEKEELLALC